MRKTSCSNVLQTYKSRRQQAGVGIAEWFYHEQITIDGNPDTVAHFRRGMKFGAPRKLSGKASWVDASVESSRVYSRTRSLKMSVARQGSKKYRDN